MKNTLLLGLFLVSASISLNSFAQAPSNLSFQAVIRNANNFLVVSSPVGVRVSLLQGSTTGTTIYAETHTPTSNTNGLITLEIGGGKVLNGDFKNINWGLGNYFIKVETDPAGGTNYSITTTTQVLSVPYALYAKKSADTDSLNTKTKELDSVVTKTLVGKPQTVGLLFFRKNADKDNEFWKSNYDGTNSVKITLTSFPSNSEIDTQSIRISPDGKKIFMLIYSAVSQIQSIYVSNSDGSGLTKLIDNVDEIFEVK